MGLGGLGGVAPQQGAQNTSKAFQKESKADMKQMVALLKEFMSDVKIITPQDQAGRRQNVSKAEGREEGYDKASARTVEVAEQQDAAQQVVQQGQEAQLGDGKKSASPEELAFAAMFADDEELSGTGKARKEDFEQKMEKLMQLEEIMMETEVENPEDKQALEEFFGTMKKLKREKKRYSKLQRDEKKYQELLDNQTDREKALGRSEREEGMLKQVQDDDGSVQGEGEIGVVSPQPVNIEELRKLGGGGPLG